MILNHCALTFKNQFYFFSITKAQFQLQGWPLRDEDLDQRVKSCFNQVSLFHFKSLHLRSFMRKLFFFLHFQCDLNRDGKITQEEFLKAGLSIAELFELESDD